MPHALCVEQHAFIIFAKKTMEFSWYEFVLLPLLIFFARIADQSVGTLRLIFLARGIKFWVPILGFCEVIIWLLAVGQILNDLTNWVAIIAYGAGFAAGNLIGMWIDEKLMIGTLIVRVIPKFDTADLIADLSSKDFGVTVSDASGARGPVKIIMSIIKRKDLSAFVEIVHKHNPNAFYTVEDVKSASDGVFRTSKRKSIFSFNSRIGK
ncbi:MAG TPA: hypothetical protein DHV29_00565 [Bacteroidales bacterium]|nr:hypothetical protein [Bacteroidales bacterium]HCB62504.1 hypothetical protein [Bacteroidales bacterium]HCY21959.1 hypothetical protein [Bacteroidales bacterium]